MRKGNLNFLGAKALRSLWISICCFGLICMWLLLQGGLWAQEVSISFVTPQDGDVVSGSNLFLWATQQPPTGPYVPVVFEVWDYDLEDWREIPFGSSPDFTIGFGDVTNVLDTTTLPEGVNWLQARASYDLGGYFGEIIAV